MSTAKWHAIEQLLPRYDLGLTAPGPLVAGPTVDIGLRPTLPTLLDMGLRPTLLEIGFGMGDATAEMAAREPHLDVIACEPHLAGVANLCRLLADGGIENVRIHPGDALDVLDALADGSLAGVRAFFPDPWPRNRHHIKRLVQPSFETVTARVLGSGGIVHLATDVADYALQMASVFTTWTPVLAPSRPMTKFERIGREAGRTIVDLAFTTG